MIKKSILLCTLAFILCILLSVAPLSRLAGKSLQGHLQLGSYVPLGRQLAQAGFWLPNDLGLTADQHASQISSNTIEFLLLMALAFAFYGLCALFIQRQQQQSDNHRTLGLIWLGAVVAGCIFVLTPALLSNDIFSYANYGHLMVAYHANPYFVAPSAYPQDPIYRYNDWPHTIAVYGPISLIVCALLELASGTNPVAYILAFRLFALAAHLLNTWLVMTTLRATGRSSRTVTLGTLLYAWNPLVLLESSLNAHNDIFMVTFLLLGILLCVRAERSDLTYPRNYLPPLVVFTLAVLVRFTAAPLVAFFIILLVRNSLLGKEHRSVGAGVGQSGEGALVAARGRGLREEHGHGGLHSPPPPLLRKRWGPPRKSTSESSPASRQSPSPRWLSAALTLLLTSMVSGIVSLALYTPFWIGHSISEIMNSFSSQPSASFAEYSIMRAILEWNKVHPPSSSTWADKLLQLFSLHTTWSYINVATLIVMLIIGSVWLWRVPTIRTVILATLATLGALLVVTYWFFPWYIIWIVGLAAVCLPIATDRIERALLAFTLTFSASALLVYLFNGYLSLGGWIGFICLTTIGPPLLAFLIFVLVRRTTLQSASATSLGEAIGT